MYENMKTIHIDKYYESLPNMKKKFDKFSRKDFFRGSSVEEFEAWKREARVKLMELLGMDKMDDVPLCAKVEEVVLLEDGITRQKVIIQTEEDVWMPMYILIPSNKTSKVFICPNGHQGAGKYSIVGMDNVEAVAGAIDKYNYAYGMQLCKMGYITICPDCRGFGERREERQQGDDPNQLLSTSCFNLSHMAEAIGETVVGMCTWDLIKLVDYIETRSEWDASDISCLGFSGGGMQTLYLAALDDRIKHVYISGYMYGFKDSLMVLNGNCNCNYVPHLWEHFDMGDIGSLIAPRTLMIQSCREDHLNGPRGLENVYEQVNIIKNIYSIYGLEQSLIHDVCEGGHRWHNEHIEEIISKFMF